MTWFKTGVEGQEFAKQEEEKAKLSKGAFRYFNKVGETGRVLFLDDAGFLIKEHNLKINGKWGNFLTCIMDVNGDNYCPICESGDRPQIVTYYTVLDLKPFKNSKGEEFKCSKKLFPAKGKVREKLYRYKASKGGLVGAIYDVTRLMDKECSTGEDFEFVEKVVPAEYFKANDLQLPQNTSLEEYLSPLKYIEVLKPKSAKVLRHILGGSPHIGEEESNFSSDSSEDIPF